MTSPYFEKTICVYHQKNISGFYYLTFFHSLRTENKLKSHQKVFKNHDYDFLKCQKNLKEY